MFESLKTAWSVMTKKESIKNVLEATYNVIVKAVVAVDVLSPELALFPATSAFVVYIPIVKLALGAIKVMIETFGPIVGFKTIIYAQSDENPAQALKAAIKELEAALENAK